LREVGRREVRGGMDIPISKAPDPRQERPSRGRGGRVVVGAMPMAMAGADARSRRESEEEKLEAPCLFGLTFSPVSF